MGSRLLGLGAIVCILSVIVFATAPALRHVGGAALYEFIVQSMCGDAYLVEPDVELRAQGIVTAAACGWDAQLYLIFGPIYAFAAGVLLIALGFLALIASQLYRTLRQRP